MTPQPKPVDLKALLDTIVKIAPSSPEIAKDLLKEFQAYVSAPLRAEDAFRLR